MTIIMSCNGCNQNLEETDLMTEMPCCGLVMHSKCAFKYVTDASYYGLSVYCPGCNEPLWGPVQWGESENSPSTPVIPSACVDELKTLKPKVSQYKKSLVVFRKKIRQSKQDFRTQVAQHIDAIKTAKKSAKDAVRSSEEYKSYTKLYRSYLKNSTALATKYNIPVRTVHKYFKIVRWRSNPMVYINRSLSIRL